MGKLGMKLSQQGSSSSDEASWPPELSEPVPARMERVRQSGGREPVAVGMLGGLSWGGRVEASLVPSLLWQHRGTWKGAARWQVGEGEV